MLPDRKPGWPGARTPFRLIRAPVPTSGLRAGHRRRCLRLSRSGVDSTAAAAAISAWAFCRRIQERHRIYDQRTQKPDEQRNRRPPARMLPSLHPVEAPYGAHRRAADAISQSISLSTQLYDAFIPLPSLYRLSTPHDAMGPLGVFFISQQLPPWGIRQVNSRRSITSSIERSSASGECT